MYICTWYWRFEIDWRKAQIKAGKVVFFSGNVDPVNFLSQPELFEPIASNRPTVQAATPTHTNSCCTLTFFPISLPIRSTLKPRSLFLYRYSVPRDTTPPHEQHLGTEYKQSLSSFLAHRCPTVDRPRAPCWLSHPPSPFPPWRHSIHTAPIHKVSTPCQPATYHLPACHLPACLTGTGLDWTATHYDCHYDCLPLRLTATTCLKCLLLGPTQAYPDSSASLPSSSSSSSS